MFLRLSDVASGLPPYEEQVLLTGMDREADHTGFSQRKAYDAVFDTLRQALAAALARRVPSGCRPRTLQTLLAYPDGCTRGETVFDPQTGNVLIQMPPLAEDKLYPKEQALVDLVAAERLAGRKVLVYATHTGTRDITERMEQFLTTHGFRVAVLKADSVAPDRREAWVEERVKQGIDVLICHPRLVQTGLDLIDFPTLCLVRDGLQRVHDEAGVAAVLAHRAEKRPVKVVFMAYRNTLQADALKLVAKKLQSSLAVEGELPEDGLAAFGDDGDDLMLALARQIVSGEETNAEGESVEEVFAKARDAEASAEEFLVDDGWRAVEVETEAVGVNGNSHHANGDDPADRVGPTVELVLGNGHMPATAMGPTTTTQNEPAEEQQSLFSWAEFMAEEPAQAEGPQGARPNPPPPPCSSGRWSRNRSGSGRKSPWAPAR